MKPLVSIIMGSTSDLPVMEKACKWLNDNQIPFEVNALSAHRTPDAVESFAKGAKERGVKVIIAAAGMLPPFLVLSQHLPHCQLSVYLSRVCSTVLMPCSASSRCLLAFLWLLLV